MKIERISRIKVIVVLFLVATLVECSSDNEITDMEEDGSEEDTTETRDKFEGPTYSDDYSGISSWADRQQWNLANVHDPTVVRDGAYFYMYSTDASYGNAHEGHGHLLVRRSKDLVSWEFMGTAFPHTPSWIKDSLNKKRTRMTPPLDSLKKLELSFWAPSIQKINGTFRLYYAVDIENPIVGDNPDSSWTERSFIGLAETPDLSSNDWNDKGMVISSIPDNEETYERDGPDDWYAYFKYNAIDPTTIETDEGEDWLIYGSWHSGIPAVQLDALTGKPYQLDEVDDYGVRIAGRGDVENNRWQGLEAPEIIYNDETGYYYLFLAYDDLSIAYNTRVARSKSIMGPYKGIDGGNVSNGAEAWPMITHPYAFEDHAGWVGLSHPAIFQNSESGQWFYASQGRLPEGIPGINASNAIMMGHVRKIEWTEDGWPLVSPERFADVPQTEITTDSVVGTWEFIDLKYDYGNIDNSSKIVFHEDGTVTGELDRDWSFDESSNVLKLGNEEVIVENGWDWEADPRTRTILFMGLTDDGITLWGKKVD